MKAVATRKTKRVRSPKAGKPMMLYPTKELGRHIERVAKDEHRTISNALRALIEDGFKYRGL